MKKQFFISFIIIFAFLGYFALVKQAHADYCVDQSVGKITSVSPSSFSYGDTITINGYGFNQSGWKYLDMRFGDTRWVLNSGNVVSWSNNQIVLKIDSVFSATSGNLVELILEQLNGTGDKRICASIGDIQWNYLPMCTSWAYSNWGTCSASGQQTRTILSSSPSGCSGGNPVIS